MANKNFSVTYYPSNKGGAPRADGEGGGGGNSAVGWGQ